MTIPPSWRAKARHPRLRPGTRKQAAGGRPETVPGRTKTATQGPATPRMPVARPA